MISQEMLDGYRAHLVGMDLRERTVQGYLQDLRPFATWFHHTNGQALEPRLVTSQDVRDYRQHLQTVIRLAPATINRRLAAIRSFCSYGVARRELDGNPAGTVKLVEEETPAPRYLDRRQLAALLRAVERAVHHAQTPPAKFRAVRNQAIVYTLAYTGLRVSELAALDLADVEISERKGRVVVRQGKRNKQRQVPLIHQARQAISAWLPLRPAGAGALYVDQDGAALQPRAIQRVLEDAAGAADVPATPHVLRHTYAKSLIDAGEQLHVVAALLGHGKLETTRRYTQPTERDLERAAERLED